MSDVFDAASFLNQSHNSGFETKFTKVEPGEYPAIIDKVGYRTAPKKDSPGEESHILDVTYFIDDARQKEVTGLDRPTVRQTVFLDIVGGKLDKSKNKNVTLGRLLTALGLNDREFSFNDLPGRACMVKVGQSPNTKDPTDPYVNVESVGKMGA